MKQQIFSIAVSDVTFSVSDFLAMLKAPTANDKVYLRWYTNRALIPGAKFSNIFYSTYLNNLLECSVKYLWYPPDLLQHLLKW